MTKKERVLKIFLCAVCVCAVAFSLFYPKTASEAAFSALKLCAERVVPSLFLFMAAAKMISKCGGDVLFAKITARSAEKLFRLSESGAAAMFLGLLSGYPTGAVVTGEFLEAGKMEKEEAERILPFITAASPAFLVGAVGGMFGSVRYGAVLLFAQIVSSLLLLLLTRPKQRPKKTGARTAENIPLLRAMTASVRECGGAVLAVCSFVTFFYVFSAMLLHFLPLHISESALGALISGICEISCGFSHLANMAESTGRYFLGGVILGFGGISVFMQSADVLGAYGISMKKYMLGKTAQALLCGIFAAAFGRIFSKNNEVSAGIFFGADHAKICALWEFAVIFLVFAALVFVILALILKILRFFSKK